MDHNSCYTSEEEMNVLCYTRSPLAEHIYSPKLAYSMHLAISNDGVNYEQLNHNSGVLFAKSTVNNGGSLIAKSLKNPYIFELEDGRFGVIAVRTEADGEVDKASSGCILLYVSTDLLSYEEIGLLDLKGNIDVYDAMCEFDTETTQYVIRWCDELGNYFQNTLRNITDVHSISLPINSEKFSLSSIHTAIEGAMERNVIQVDSRVGKRLRNKLCAIKNTEMYIPATSIAESVNELANIRATAIYSDGSTATKNVAWDTSNVDWNVGGTYQISGTVQQEHYSFPMAIHRADPAVVRWNNQYYFIATDDSSHGNLCLYVRESDTIQGLGHASEHLILDKHMYPSLKIHFWAPEFHEIGEDLYLYFACSSGEFIDIQCHVMKLKSNGNPTHASDWEAPVKMEKQDGSYLFDAGITLDMTYFEVDEKHYVVWAQRQFDPIDLGSWLYIATIDPSEPWRLQDDPVLISRPDYGWANNQTFVDEGAFAIIAEDKIYLTFSSALVNATYCVGLLTAERGTNLLDSQSWVKGNYPLLTSRSVEGEYGPGHNSYIEDDAGNLLMIYHARYGLEAPRSTGIRRVHFAADGSPVLDMIEANDLNDTLKNVTMQLIVPNKEAVNESIS
ncbi:family 43 glycosylhydrolase [Paenibacillus crassostreae]|uniref:Glycosyl hydrolase n=1 Tax=Paenibacillus crassostreae TaxID=1763538 RepID=A0A167GBI6_9BACL|nr:family 43 glycosylhydrolase [Paenibacillus crassostreae]AOZ92647.1 glycosyl hydrolase [Paenibacillus crassostreae]OAB77416.1 glycosyl hydrolase [Paenibacillus crassostreae]